MTPEEIRRLKWAATRQRVLATALLGGAMFLLYYASRHGTHWWQSAVMGALLSMCVRAVTRAAIIENDALLTEALEKLKTTGSRSG